MVLFYNPYLSGQACRFQNFNHKFGQGLFPQQACAKACTKPRNTGTARNDGTPEYWNTGTARNTKNTENPQKTTL